MGRFGGRKPQKDGKNNKEAKDKKENQGERKSFVPKYEFFAKAKLASYPNESGVCVHLEKGQDEKAFFALPAILKGRSGKNEELCRRLGMGMTLDAASINNGIKVLQKRFGAGIPEPLQQQLHKTGIPTLLESLATDDGKAFVQAVGVLDVGKTGKPKEKKVKKAVTTFVEYLCQSEGGLQKNLARLASDSAAFYLLAMTFLKDLAMFQDPKPWAGKVEGKQSEEVKSWQRKPKDQEKLISALTAELMSKIKSHEPEAGKKRKASDSSSEAQAASDDDASEEESSDEKKASEEDVSSKAGSASEEASDSTSSSKKMSATKKKKKKTGKDKKAGKSKKDKEKPKEKKDKNKKAKKDSSSASSSSSNAKKAKKPEKEEKAKTEKHLKEKKSKEPRKGEEKPKAAAKTGPKEKKAKKDTAADAAKAAAEEEERRTAAFTLWSASLAQEAAEKLEDAKASIGLMTGRFRTATLMELIRLVPHEVMVLFSEAYFATAAIEKEEEWTPNVDAKSAISMLLDIANAASGFWATQSQTAAGSEAPEKRKADAEEKEEEDE